MTDKVQKIREEVKRLMHGFNLEADIASCEDAETEKIADIKYQLCKKILEYIDEIQKESVNDDLLTAANKAWHESEDKESYAETFIDGFVACFNWKKDNDIEYISIDAFIEKACEWVEENIEKFVSVDGEYTIYYDDMRKDLIEYMKGE